MFAKWRERRTAAHRVQVCESCGQVCASNCKAQARLDRIRAESPYRIGMLR
jgi:ferredoxin